VVLIVYSNPLWSTTSPIRGVSNTSIKSWRYSGISIAPILILWPST
jgi:hypothetical protein